MSRRMLIGGELVDASDGGTFPVINPATEQIIGYAPSATRSDLDQAISAAHAAFPDWRDRPLSSRQATVAAIGTTMALNVEAISELFTAEQGRPTTLARAEVLRAAEWLQAVATLAPPEQVIEDNVERRVSVRHVPLGVVGAIAPWNAPIILAMWKVAPALVAGNCVILKPSPFTPLAMLKIADLAARIAPAGVLNVITGGDQLGPWLTEHPGINKVSFTGSTATGRKVMASAASTLKRVTLELGGNDPAIVLHDVDLDEVVPKIFWAAFPNTGQICIASKRIYVHNSIYDRFRDALVRYSRTIRIGNGAEDGVQLGPIQNRPQFEHVRALIADCEASGYAVIKVGESSQPGYFLPICFVDNPPDQSRIVREEPFGPVVPLLRFNSFDEVVARANDSEYGLAASIWTRDLSAASLLATRLECGTVWVNETRYVMPGQPFGGHKQSGLGVEGGIDGLLEYMNSQTIVVRKAAGSGELASQITQVPRRDLKDQ